MGTTTSTAQRLRIIRGNVSRAEFAKLLDVHPNTLGRYERGQTEPDFTFARSICTKFGVEPGWLLFGTGPMASAQAAPQAYPDGTAPRGCGQAPAPHRAEPLKDEFWTLLRENRELRQENSELNKALRGLLAENADLRVALAQHRKGAG